MHPLHAHLHAMDGSRAYLTRLAELPEEYHAAQGAAARASVHHLYYQIRRRFVRHYPHLEPPTVPACFAQYVKPKSLF